MWELHIRSFSKKDNQGAILRKSIPGLRSLEKHGLGEPKEQGKEQCEEGREGVIHVIEWDT